MYVRGHRTGDTQVDDALDVSRPAARLGVLRQQRACREPVFQVLDDGERLHEVGAIVQFEHRQRAERVPCQVLGLPIAALQGIHHDLLDAHVHAQLGALSDVEHDFGRVRRQRHHVQFHRFLSTSPTAAMNSAISAIARRAAGSLSAGNKTGQMWGDSG